MATGSGDLADRIAGIVGTSNTHARLAGACANFGFQAANEGSKFDRVRAGLADKSPREIFLIAEKVGVHCGNFELEEEALAFLENGEPPLTEIARRDIARCFDNVSISGEINLLVFLKRVWPIDNMMFGGDIFGPTLTEKIERHMIRNEDWSLGDLFEKLGAWSCSRKRFAGLIEAALHPLARSGVEQKQLAERLNVVLARDGYRLDVAGFESRYPVYRVTTLTGGVAGRPKNLIFASIGPKPEIGFRDAVNNDIIILSNGDSCLVYDRPIADDGLSWSELGEWWRTTHCEPGTSPDEARVRLGKRLRESLTSDAERGLFDWYFRRFRPVLGDSLPALIPQVYLHYDPAIVARLRHREGLPRQRMDFLLLLPHKARVVIEVDGQHHFSEDDKPSLRTYAKMVKADRELRLQEYEIYRFGANELVGAGCENIVQAFFAELFNKHRVNSS
jgi:very-short-patch-repair endonuclease